MLTLAVFLAPALLSPGPLEIANVAGIALAMWLAVDAWRVYGREDRADTFAYRVGPVAPGLIGSAALVFAVAIGHGWNAEPGAASPVLIGVADELFRLWSFPFSPLSLFVDPGVRSPPVDAAAVRGVTLCLSMAVVCGLLFGLLSFIVPVRRPETLRRHALIWAGVKPEERGAKLKEPRLRGRLFARFLSLLVAICALAFGPAFFRIFTGISSANMQAFLESPLMNNLFFSVWVIGIWGAVLAGAIILAFAHLRLAFALTGR